MAQEIGQALIISLPYINLALASIVIVMFLIMFHRRKSRNMFILPWKFLFAAVIVFIVEEIVTVLKTFGMINFGLSLSSILELIIICLFIYMLLLQRDYMLDPDNINSA